MTSKTCNKCNEIKSISEFFKDKSNKTDGHYSICKVCKTNATLSWRTTNREAYNKAQRLAHRHTYARDRLYRYKLTPEQHATIMLEQKGICAVCGKVNPSTKRSLSTDHNPKTNEVRGVLCYGCNRLQRVFDVEGLLEKFMRYNNNPPARRALLKLKGK